jgi:hypothetical protein
MKRFAKGEDRMSLLPPPLPKVPQFHQNVQHQKEILPA